MRKIAKFFIQLFDPICLLMILYRLNYSWLCSLSIITSIRYLMLIVALLMIFSGIFTFFSKKNKKITVNDTRIKNKSFYYKLFYFSEYIVNYSFLTYFVVYLIFRLDAISIFFNYFIVFEFSLYLGYKLARKAYDYLKVNQN